MLDVLTELSHVLAVAPGEWNRDRHNCAAHLGPYGTEKRRRPDAVWWGVVWWPERPTVLLETGAGEHLGMEVETSVADLRVTAERMRAALALLRGAP